LTEDECECEFSELIASSHKWGDRSLIWSSGGESISIERVGENNLSGEWCSNGEVDKWNHLIVLYDEDSSSDMSVLIVYIPYIGIYTKIVIQFNFYLSIS